MPLQDNWLDLAAPEIQSRIAKYSASEIRFNLLAVIGDRQGALNQQIKTAEAKRQAITDKLTGSAGPAAMEMDEAARSSAEQQQQQLLDLPNDEGALQQLLAETEGQIVRWVEDHVSLQR